MSKKPVPKRLCRDPHTKYCAGRWGHRGCCNCWEYNHGDWDDLGCLPYNLPGYFEEDDE